ncbi:PelD GGDEF domain-containing protein [Azonexus hydrophilus]|uniref:PelD GGDEF domain-containing protein n=1 Tax=Azonexus hydrophilus TaxID=418702 RepID=A0ABZ2XLD1_9RHOO
MTQLHLPGSPGSDHSKTERQSQHDEAAGWSLSDSLTSPIRHRWAVAGEIALLPVIGLLIGYLINPEDFLFMESQYPWIWLAPSILALRYGPMPGLAGCVTILVAWAATHGVESFPKIYFMGGLIQIMLIGEFSSLWINKNRRTDAMHEYLSERFQALTHQHYLLRLSHDRLEQDLIAKPMAMRDAIAAMQHDISVSGNSQESANTLLRVLAQYCQIEEATLLAVDDDEMTDRVIAKLGTPEPVNTRDPLIRLSLDNRNLMHAGETLHDTALKSQYLVAAPLVNVTGTCFGMLVVKRMPFVSMRDDILLAITLLLAYYADTLSSAAVCADVIAKTPSCPLPFAFQTKRMEHLANVSHVRSVLVLLLTDSGNQTACDILIALKKQKRTVDENWLHETEQKTGLLTLMPLSGRAAAEGYLNRINLWTTEKYDTPIAASGISCHFFEIDNRPNSNALQEAMDLFRAD